MKRVWVVVLSVVLVVGVITSVRVLATILATIVGGQVTVGAGNGMHVYVDNNTSNVDSSADKGTQSNFTAQQYGPDSIVDTLTETTNYSSTVMSFSPDYRWELDGNENDSVDAAHSDGGNDPSWVSNIILCGESQCGDYDGTSDVTLIPNQADINLNNTLEKSISVWVEVDTVDTSGNGRVIWGEGGGLSGLALYVLDVGGEDRLYAVVYEDSGATVDYCYATISTGTLYHIGLTLDAPAEELILYINGVEVANDTSLAIGTTFGTHSGGIAIGRVNANLKNHNNNTLNGYFDGRIADVAYYAEQTVLAEEDFAIIYAAGIGGYVPSLAKTKYAVTGSTSEITGGPDQNYALIAKGGTCDVSDYQGGTVAIKQVYFNITYYGSVSGTLAWAYQLDGGGWNNIEDLPEGGNTSSPLTRTYNATSLRASWTWSNLNTTDVQFQNNDGAGPEDAYVDAIYVTVTADIANYEMDLEFQWTNVDYDEANEELCIYGGAMGSENLRVDVWNGSSWQNVIANLNSGWNNVTVSALLVSSTFTIRFKGSIETADVTQDSWDIDATLLHVWT